MPKAAGGSTATNHASLRVYGCGGGPGGHSLAEHGLLGGGNRLIFLRVFVNCLTLGCESAIPADLG